MGVAPPCWTVDAAVRAPEAHTWLVMLSSLTHGQDAWTTKGGVEARLPPSEDQITTQMCVLGFAALLPSWLSPASSPVSEPCQGHSAQCQPGATSQRQGQGSRSLSPRECAISLPHLLLSFNFLLVNCYFHCDSSPILLT